MQAPRELSAQTFSEFVYFGRNWRRSGRNNGFQIWPNWAILHSGIRKRTKGERGKKKALNESWAGAKWAWNKHKWVLELSQEHQMVHQEQSVYTINFAWLRKFSTWFKAKIHPIPAFLWKINKMTQKWLNHTSSLILFPDFYWKALLKIIFVIRDIAGIHQLITPNYVHTPFLWWQYWRALIKHSICSCSPFIPRNTNSWNFS